MSVCIKCILRSARNELIHKKTVDGYRQFRCLGSLSWSGKPYNDWNTAVSNAEKIVGYPTSFMSLRYLLSDEFSNIAMHMRKMVGTKHPLLKTARGLIYDGKHSMQTRGLIVLLMSKAAGPGPEVKNVSDSEQQDMICGIYPSQRSLAEITEMIHTANLIHKGVVNMKDLVGIERNEKNDMEFGNKMAVLSGDFLLANACTGLAELRNTYVVESISKAIGDLMEAEFLDSKDESGKPILKQDTVFTDWLKQTYLSSASLLSKSCRSAMELANHHKEYQDAAQTFGENMAYAHQIKEDLKPFLHPDEHLGQLSVTSLPVIKYIENGGKVQQLLVESDKINCKKIYETLSSTTLLKESAEICEEYGNKAKESLDVFDSSDAKLALINMVDATVKS